MHLLAGHFKCQRQDKDHCYELYPICSSARRDMILMWLPLAGEKQIESLPATSSLIRT